MKKLKHTYWTTWKSSTILLVLLSLVGCDKLGFKTTPAGANEGRIPIARVNNAYLFQDELVGIASAGANKEDSASRVQAYVDSWVRKQLLIQEATKRIDINEAEIERKILDYRYSIIAYEYQAQYIKQNLDTVVSKQDIDSYYKNNLDNFILKQNIVRATFIKVPKNAPRTDKTKDLIFSRDEKDHNELRSYCLSFSTAYHLADSSWIIFDELVKNSPLVEIPNKIQFLKTNPYYETSDDSYLYFFKVVDYRISDSVSPLEFVRDEIKNIILNKRKIELVKNLEERVYQEAIDSKEFEIFK